MKKSVTTPLALFLLHKPRAAPASPPSRSLHIFDLHKFVSLHIFRATFSPLAFAFLHSAVIKRTLPNIGQLLEKDNAFSTPLLSSYKCSFIIVADLSVIMTSILLRRMAQFSFILLLRNGSIYLAFLLLLKKFCNGEFQPFKILLGDGSQRSIHGIVITAEMVLIGVCFIRTLLQLKWCLYACFLPNTFTLLQINSPHIYTRNRQANHKQKHSLNLMLSRQSRLNYVHAYNVRRVDRAVLLDHVPFFETHLLPQVTRQLWPAYA